MDTGTIAPIVSVIIPAYRAADDIGEALASVFAQNFSHFEVIVVNDGSPDTPELEAAIAPYRSQIRYIVQPNGGAGAARNAALRVARGSYVAFLDADDLWLKDFLRRQVWFLDANADCALVYGDAMIAGESPLAGRTFMATAPSDGDVTLLSLIEERCNIPLSTVVARRDAIEAVGRFDQTLRRGQDVDLWLRLAAAGYKIAYQRLLVGTRRVRRNGLSGNAVAQLERAISVLDRFGRRNELPVQARTALRIRTLVLMNRLEVEQGKQRLIEGDFAAARYHMEVSKPKTLRVRAALVALRFAPQLLRRLYLAMSRTNVARPSMHRHTAAVR